MRIGIDKHLNKVEGIWVGSFFVLPNIVFSFDHAGKFLVLQWLFWEIEITCWLR